MEQRRWIGILLLGRQDGLVLLIGKEKKEQGGLDGTNAEGKKDPFGCSGDRFHQAAYRSAASVFYPSFTIY